MQTQTFEEQKEEFLAHYGVKGMKWGKRKRNPNYSDQQVKRDKQVYGARGTKRINKNMNKGDQISTARAMEKTRRDRVMGRNKYARQAGKVAGAGIGVAAVNLGISAAAKAVNSQVGASVVNKLFGQATGNLINVSINVANQSPIVRAVASAGAAKVGTMLAGDAAVAVNMRAAGYDPSRK